MKKMKIGINASFLRKPYTGIGQVTLNFLKKLALTDDQNEYFLYLDDDLPAGTRFPENFHSTVIRSWWKRDDLFRKIIWEKNLLPRRAKKDGCQAFLSLYQCPTIVSGMEHLMVVHDIIPKLFPQYRSNVRQEIYWRLTERGIKRASRILAVSKHTEKDLVRHLGLKGEKITTNYIAAGEEFDSAGVSAGVLRKYKLKPGYILAGGGFETRKNIAGVVAAYKQLLGRNKTEHFLESFPKLVIYGKLLPSFLPAATDIEKILKEENLTRDVKLLGQVTPRDLKILFREAVCFVYPSFYEGFGLQVLEAMKCGTPVITAKNSSLPEVGLDGALYCHADDIDDIAMVMKNLLTKEHLRKELTRRGLERAKHFSWDKFVQKSINIIKTEVDGATS